MQELPMKVKILIYIIISLLCTLIGCFLLTQSDLQIDPDKYDGVSIMLSQVSSTFIVLSLTSVLSTNIGTVYWIDIKDVKLIKPFLTCFYALTTYLITLMIASIAGCFIESIELELVAFVLSVLILIALTVKMLSVYFGRERIKNDLRWEYIIAYYKTGKWERLTKNKYSDILNKTESDRSTIQNKKAKEFEELIKINNPNFAEQHGPTVLKAHDPDKKATEKWKDHSDKIIENTSLALSGNNQSLVNENVELLLLAEDMDSIFKILDDLMLRDPILAAEIIDKDEFSHIAGPLLRRKYAATIFNILVKEKNCDSTKLYNILRITVFRKPKQNRLIQAFKDKSQLSEEEIDNIVDKYKDLPMIDTYFPNTELLESYYCHRFHMCENIVQAAYRSYASSYSELLRDLPVEKSDESEQCKQITLKYISDDIWGGIERLLQKDEELCALPEKIKQDLMHMRYFKFMIKV